MTRYAVGQVLFVVLKKENRVMPVQIVEEITKKTLDGEVITHMVRVGANAETIAITDVNGEIFDTAEKLRKTLIERATVSLNKIVDGAVQKSKEWYPTGFASDATDQLASVRKPRTMKKQQAIEQEEPTAPVGDESFVELADGTRARIRMSKDLGS